MIGDSNGLRIAYLTSLLEVIIYLCTLCIIVKFLKAYWENNILLTMELECSVQPAKMCRDIHIILASSLLFKTLCMPKE